MGGNEEERGRIATWSANIAEGTAASASLLCLVHCLALPLLLLVLPAAIAAYAMADTFHWIILAGLAPFALVAFWLGYRRHRNVRPAVLGAFGISCLAVALWPGLPLAVELSLTVGGSILLVAAHLRNWRLRANAT